MTTDRSLSKGVQPTTRRTLSSSAGQREKLVQQHDLLSAQLRDAATKLDQIILKEKSKRLTMIKGGGAAIGKLPAEDDQENAQWTQQLRKQDQQLMSNKARIAALRKRLDGNGLVNYLDQENELKHIKEQLKKQQQKTKVQRKIRQKQSTAIDQFTVDASLDNNQDSQFRQILQENKRVLEEVQKYQREVRRLHEAVITKEEKLEEAEKRIENASKKKKESKQTVRKYVDIDKLIQELHQSKQIKQAQKIKILKLQQEINMKLDKTKKQSGFILQKKILELKQKQRQLRLQILRNKDLKRFESGGGGMTVSHQSDPRARIVSRNGRQLPRYVKKVVGGNNGSQQRRSERGTVASQGGGKASGGGGTRSHGVGDDDVNNVEAYLEDFD